MRNAEVIRQWQILRAVESARTGITIHDLARETRVTTRTIRRDLTALQEAGFALFDEGEGNETKRWKFNAAPFRAVQDGLSVADVAALYLSRSIVVALSGWPLVDELGAALAKLDSALNPRMREFLSTLPQVVSTKAGPRAGAASVDRLAPLTRRLFDAVRDRHIVEMAYFSASSNRAKSYTVHPYRIALALGGVYLVGWVPQYDEFRTFAVERIQKLSISEETFRKSRELPADLFASSMGVFWGEPARVVIEFAARLAPYVQGRVWHPSQQVETQADGRLTVTLDVSIDWALRAWILGFGSGVKVVEPKTLAKELRDEHKKALAESD
ncbi:MAG: WYL domain-containing protein [Acidobacteriota bacterium]